MSTVAVSRKITGETRALIAQSVQEVLEDPDFGLVLSGRAKTRLQHARVSKGKTISLSEVKKKYL